MLYIASWESGSYLYQSFGKSKEVAINSLIAGYTANVKRISGDKITPEEIKTIRDEVNTEPIKEGKTLLNHGCEGWI